MASGIWPFIFFNINEDKSAEKRRNRKREEIFKPKPGNGFF